MIFVREDIPNKALNKHILPEDIETVFIELNLRKQKWLPCGTYQPPPSPLPSQKNKYYFYDMGKAIHTNHQIYDKFLLTRDFNTKDTEPCLLQFVFAYDANNLMNEKTCLKSKT